MHQEETPGRCSLTKDRQEFGRARGRVRLSGVRCHRVEVLERRVWDVREGGLPDVLGTAVLLGWALGLGRRECSCPGAAVTSYDTRSGRKR